VRPGHFFRPHQTIEFGSADEAELHRLLVQGGAVGVGGLATCAALSQPILGDSAVTSINERCIESRMRGSLPVMQFSANKRAASAPAPARPNGRYLLT